LAFAKIYNLSHLTEFAQKGTFEAKQVYRTRFSVVDVKCPKDLISAVKVVNIKTGAFKDATAKSTTAKGKEKLVFVVEFFVKDYTNILTNSFVKIVLAFDDNHKFFPNIKPADILKKAETRKAVQASLEILKKFNVWVEAAVTFNKDR
jgi:hypothetical protein